MTNTKVADTLLDFLVTERQPEVAEALVAGSLVVPSDTMRDKLGQKRAARGEWPPGVYVPVVIRLSRHDDGPAVALLSRVTQRALAPVAGLAVAEDRYAAECFHRLTGDAPTGRPRTLTLVARPGLQFDDLRSARAAFVLARLLARRGVELSRPVVVTGDVADPSGYGPDLAVLPVDEVTFPLKVVAATAPPGVRVFVPAGQAGMPAGEAVRAVASVRELYEAVTGCVLPPVHEETIEVEARRLKMALRSGNVSEEVAGRIAHAAGEYLEMVAGCTDRWLIPRLKGVRALALSRSGRAEAAETTLSEALADPEVDDPDVRCMLTNVLALAASDRGAYDRAVGAVAELRAVMQATGQFANPTELHDLCGTEILVRSHRALTSRAYDAELAALLSAYREYDRSEPGRVASYESLVHHVLSDDPEADPALDSIFDRALTSRDAPPRCGPTIYAFAHRLGVLGRARRYEQVLREYDAWLGDPGGVELEDHVTEGVGVLWQVIRAQLSLGSRALVARARGERAQVATRVADATSPFVLARLAACDVLFGVFAGARCDLAAPLATIRDAHDPSSAVAMAAGALLTECDDLAEGALRARVDALLDLLA